MEQVRIKREKIYTRTAFVQLEFYYSIAWFLAICFHACSLHFGCCCIRNLTIQKISSISFFRSSACCFFIFFLHLWAEKFCEFYRRNEKKENTKRKKNIFWTKNKHRRWTYIAHFCCLSLSSLVIAWRQKW